MEDVKATPGKVVESVKVKTLAVVDDIKAIPGKVCSVMIRKT